MRRVQAGVDGCRQVQTGASQAGACRCGGPGVAVEAVVGDDGGGSGVGDGDGSWGGVG